MARKILKFPHCFFVKSKWHNFRTSKLAVLAILKALNMPKAALEKAEAELKKLRNMGPMSAEATVVRNYLDWMLSLPWKP